METKEFNVGDVVTFGDNNVGIVTKVSLTGVYAVNYFDLDEEDPKLNRTHLINPDGYIKGGTDQDKKNFPNAMLKLARESSRKVESPKYLNKVRVGDVVTFGDRFVGIIAKADNYYWSARYIYDSGEVCTTTCGAGEGYFKEASESQRNEFFKSAVEGGFTFRDFFEFKKGVHTSEA